METLSAAIKNHRSFGVVEKSSKNQNTLPSDKKTPQGRKSELTGITGPYVSAESARTLQKANLKRTDICLINQAVRTPKVELYFQPREFRFVDGEYSPVQF